MNVALQLYTIRRELAQDAERTLERIKAMGIEAVEVAPLPEGLPSERLANLLRASELKVAAIHCDLPLDNRLQSVVDLAREMACARIIWHGWPRDPGFETIDGVKLLANRYNEAHANAQQHGLQLGLHNHWWEFELVQGRFPYHVLLEKLDPQIFLEVDTYWVRAAGLNPASVLHELKDRVRFLHLKDGSTVKGEPMQALGDGLMDFPSILEAATPSVDWLVIELDECASDIWNAVRRSFEYLRSLNPPQR
jgi:sugar phosphate isomerase/epimerase